MIRLFVVCTLLIMTACSGGDTSDSGSENNSNPSEGNTTGSTSSKTVREGMKPLQLNDGQPWKAGDEMIQQVTAMKGLLAENWAVEEIDQVYTARSLDSHTSKLIDSCTMKGQGHEELHKWLVPYMALIKDLHNSQSQAEAKEIVVELKAMLDMFDKYFE